METQGRDLYIDTISVLMFFTSGCLMVPFLHGSLLLVKELQLLSEHPDFSVNQLICFFFPKVPYAFHYFTESLLLLLLIVRSICQTEQSNSIFCRS